MAKVRPEYEVNDQFNTMAAQVVEKYANQFYGIKVDQICCVNIINKERPEGKKKVWQLDAVKMPMALHCTYGYYVTLYSTDWESYTETQKLLLVAEILHGVPTDDTDGGKVNPMDTKGYSAMFRTFRGIDYMDDPKSPNILQEEVEWVK